MVEATEEERDVVVKKKEGILLKGENDIKTQDLGPAGWGYAAYSGSLWK